MNLKEKLAFIDSIVPYAVQSMLDYGIPASATIAQAILETGWGRKAPGNNMFGVKISSKRKAEIMKLVKAGVYKPGNLPDDVQVIWTHEENEAGRYKIQAVFRAYPNVAASFAHRETILMGTRYYHAMRASTDPMEFCRQLQSCGWATAHDYAENLISIINRYGLVKYDRKEE